MRCNRIPSDWGRQRVKGLSIEKIFLHFLKKYFFDFSSLSSQKNTETSLIESFLYPKFGPGQMWEEVAKRINGAGGVINLNCEVVGITYDGNCIISLKIKDRLTGLIKEITGDYFFSTMPIKELVSSFNKKIPDEVSRIAKGLIYRDFITVGLFLNELKIKNKTKIKTINDIVPDNWIYIQEKEVKIGRLQIFNNWSPYMISNRNNVWIGLEYFCNEGDELWNMSDKDFIDFAINEIVKVGFIDKKDVLDSMIIREKKAYPAYFGTYNEFDVIKKFVDNFENLFLIGRNGMHRYNNMDHSMLTAMKAVENIKNNIKTKENIWNINTEGEYQEEKKS